MQHGCDAEQLMKPGRQPGVRVRKAHLSLSSGPRDDCDVLGQASSVPADVLLVEGFLRLHKLLY